MNTHARIIKTTGDAGEKLFRRLDHLFIDLADIHDLELRVLPRLAQHAAVATADDKQSPRILVRKKRNVREHLMIGKFIEFGQLDDAVEQQQPPEL